MFSMRITVRNKIIAGFALFAGLLIITNIMSYLGLSDIRHSAESVVEEKMPLQAKMLEIQNQILTIANESLQGSYSETPALLESSRQRYQSQSDSLLQQLEALHGLMVNQDNRYRDMREQVQGYIAFARAMYQQRSALLQARQDLQTRFEDMRFVADEAGALLADLSYMDGAEDDPAISRLVGAANRVDTLIIPLVNVVKGLIDSQDPETSQSITDNLQFALSDLENNVQFVERLSQGIETDGIIDAFKEQYNILIPMLDGPDGIQAAQQQRLDVLAQSQESMRQAESQLALATGNIASLFKQVNASTLEGQNEILDVVTANIVKGLVILLVALTMVVVIGFTLGRTISKPLARINRSLDIISGGDLTHKAKVVGNDEFSSVAENVNRLSEALRQLVSQIIEQEIMLSQATETSVSLGKSTLQQVAEQQEQVLINADNTQEIKASSQHNVEQIHQGMNHLAEVQRQTNNMGNLVNQSRTQIERQAQQAQESSDIISRLDENSKRIGGILDVIKTIAEQTNLLALNAAIEAARAGEQGRGFAVVADEVRTLANRTHESTEEIENMIGSLQEDAKQAVKAISEGKAQSEDSVELIKKVFDDVTTIEGIISELSAVNQQIVTDSDNQNSLLEGMASRLETIVALAEKSADTTRQANEATLQVDELVEHMRQTVAKFKV